MKKHFLSIHVAAAVFIFFAASVDNICAQDFSVDTVVVQSDNLRLKGLLWEPPGTGSHPAIIFCHGSLGGTDTIHDPLREASLLGNVFASQGYIFFELFRRGAALSKNEGVNSTDLMDNAFKEKGQ